MSIFSFPRIHFKGLMAVNVGTGNNDDYSGKAIMGPNYPGYESLPLRQADSPNVQPLTYGMTDEQWVAWAQAHQQFAPVPGTALLGAKAGLEPPAEVNKGEGGTDGADTGEGPTATATASPSVYYVPGEWNYFGDMGLTFIGATVTSVVTGPGTVVTDPAAQPVIGAAVSFNNRPDDTGRSTGLLVDVNAEDVPSSQVIAESVMVAQNGTALLAGAPGKAVTRFINFQRNFNLNGPNGAGCLFQCVLPLASLGASPLLEQFPTEQDGVPLSGVVLHYYMYRPLQEINTFKYTLDAGNPDSPWFAQIEARYRQAATAPGGQPTPGMTPQEVQALFAANGLNPDYVQVVGTLSPAYAGEVASSPVGRFLVASGTIPAKGTRGNAGPPDAPTFQLAPAVVNVDRAAGIISADLSGTFPDDLQGTDYDPLRTDDNPKWSFGPGPASLVITDGTNRWTVGRVDYADTDAGDAAGWIFDFPLSGLPEGAPSDLDAVDFELWAPVNQFDGSVQDVQLLVEQEYMVVSDQAAIFGEQRPAGPAETQFISDSGTPQPARIRVFRRGTELAAGNCPAVTVWEYDTTPNQDPGPLTLITSTFGPGQDLEVDTAKNGNRLYTFTVQGQAPPPGFTGIRTSAAGSDDDTLYPPMQYGNLPLAYASMVNLRILPNDADYSPYYVPGTNPPVGNDALTFDVVYNEVLRNYYLLYPAMSKRVPLNDPSYWSDPEMAMRLYQRTQLGWWARAEYMPRTRDLSDSRRTLLQAWTLKFFSLPGGSGTGSGSGAGTGSGGASSGASTNTGSASTGTSTTTGTTVDATAAGTATGSGTPAGSGNPSGTGSPSPASAAQPAAAAVHRPEPSAATSGTLRRLLGVAAVALAILALALMLGAAPAAAQLPFTFSVRAAAAQPGAPGLQSLALGEHDGLWLLVGGRRNGFHRTSDRESTFPSAWANDTLYVVDVAGGRTWRAPLPQQYRMLLRVNNMQSYQDGNTLYVVGGYGSRCDTDDRTCYQTYPNLTAIDVPGVVQAVQAGDAGAIAAGIVTVQDERMRVTGGGLRKIGDTFYLVMGQNYDSIYKGGYTGKYTEEVRSFRIANAGGTLQIQDYVAYPAQDGGGPASQWHRRDLNVVETVWGDGTAGIAVYGGVFTPAGGAWANPIYVSAPQGGPARVSVDGTFGMRMSQYECAQVLMFDPATGTMYTTLLGGISGWYYDASGRLVPGSIDNWLPWTAAITTLARDASGTTTEVVQPASMQMPQRMGGNAVFVPNPALAVHPGTREVLDYARLPAGDSVLVGWMYGGIWATADQASEFNPTFANDQVYEVWMNRAPPAAPAGS